MSCKTYTDGTLKSMTKDQLIEHIRCLEHNWRVAEERIDNQYKLLCKVNEETIVEKTDTYMCPAAIYKCLSCGKLTTEPINYCTCCGRKVKVVKP